MKIGLIRSNMFIKVKNIRNNKETYINIYNFSFIKYNDNNNLLFKDNIEMYELEFKTKKAREEFIDKLINNNLINQDVK